jgi:hypothetical protein
MSIIDNGLPPIPTPTTENMAEWNKWKDSRPSVVREMCDNLPPWYYYDIPKTGQICVPIAYNENGTVRVIIVGDRISIPSIMQIEVFGVSPSDLVRRA